jgi:hypothetical protein
VATALEPASLPAEPAHPLRRVGYIAAAAGTAHALLFLLSYWLVTSQPGARASDSELEAFYRDAAPRRLIVVGLYLMPFAGIAFVWFSSALRMWIGGVTSRREDVLLSNVQLVSGIIYVALFFAAAAAAAAQAASVEYSSAPVDGFAARQLPVLGNTLLYVFAMRMAAMFIFATSNIGRTAGFLPMWFVIVGFVVGLFLLLSATFNQLLILAFPIWILALVVIMMLHARRLAAQGAK